MKYLGELHELRNLSLWNTKVTDAGLKRLNGLKGITSLNVGKTGVTIEGVRDFQAAHSNCEIDR
jgi:hypothetical protein